MIVLDNEVGQIPTKNVHFWQCQCQCQCVEAADDRHACPTLPSRASPWFNAASFWSSQKAGAASVGSTIPELPSFKTAKPAFSFLQQLHWSRCGPRCPRSGRGVINFIFCYCFVFPSSTSFNCHTQLTNIKGYNRENCYFSTHCIIHWLLHQAKIEL